MTQCTNDRELGAFNSGFEYIVAHSQPPRMFIIHRREVQAGGKRDKVDAIYWILNDRIYPTPTLYDIMANRTVRYTSRRGFWIGLDDGRAGG
jgi:mediator of RNA polymerase II transcription subunit 6